MTGTDYKRPPLNIQTLVFMLKETWREWQDDRVPLLGAALAFYSMLSVGPLLLIVISIAGAAFGNDNASSYIMAEVRRLIGDQGAAAIAAILANSHNPTSNYIATWIGIVTLLVSATGFFAQLQDALNAIWNIEGKVKADIKWFIKKRLLSFAMILGIGFLLLVALVISAALSIVSHYFSGFLPTLLMHGMNLFVSFVVVTVLFAMIFKILPDVHIRWRDVWFGAAITALLFSFGKFLIGVYLGHSAFASTYGAAGSLIVVLVWIYYSTQIFFLGAEFTQVYTRYMGRQIVLKRGRRLPVNIAKEGTDALAGTKAKDIKPADVAVAQAQVEAKTGAKDS